MCACALFECFCRCCNRWQLWEQSGSFAHLCQWPKLYVCVFACKYSNALTKTLLPIEIYRHMSWNKTFIWQTLTAMMRLLPMKVLNSKASLTHNNSSCLQTCTEVFCLSMLVFLFVGCYLLFWFCLFHRVFYNCLLLSVLPFTYFWNPEKSSFPLSLAILCDIVKLRYSTVDVSSKMTGILFLIYPNQILFWFFFWPRHTCLWTVDICFLNDPVLLFFTDIFS